ncbi:MAG: hypothetical protein QM501_14380 [Gimesia sp.]
MHKFTYKLAGLIAVAGIMTVLSTQNLQAGEPGSLNSSQRAGSPITNVGYFQDKCGCKQHHKQSYTDSAAYTGGNGNCPHCRTGSSVRSAGIGKRGSLLDFFRFKKKHKAKGVAPFGRYNITYAVDPYHFDQRDGRPLYGAQGYGVPIAVPLAPNVHKVYNYGWGIPSSRLTPVSRIVQ